MDMAEGDTHLARRFGSVASSPPCLGVRSETSSVVEDTAYGAVPCCERWDEDSESCSICHVLLGRRRLRLRHHCRICGRCVCGPCSPNMITVPGYSKDLQRACTPCLAIAHKAPMLKSRLSQLGAKLVSFSSSEPKAMTIPIESLDGMLALCEDACTPLEGLQARLAAAEAEAKRVTAELEQEKIRCKRLEARLRSATEGAVGLEKRMLDWLQKEAVPEVQEVEDTKKQLQPRSLEQAMEGCSALISRLQAVRPPSREAPCLGGGDWEPDSSQCGLCSVSLGKRHLRPMILRAMCLRKVLAKLHCIGSDFWATMLLQMRAAGGALHELVETTDSNRRCAGGPISSMGLRP